MQRLMFLIYWSVALPSFITGCAIFSDSNSESIKLVSERPDQTQCQFVSQAVGQGGGDVISISSSVPQMREDAIEQIRGIAEVRGGNVVQVLEVQNDNLSDEAETIGTVIGHVYHCGKTAG